ncbi:MAG: aspartate--tRNA ligase [Psychroflexus sp.]
MYRSHKNNALRINHLNQNVVLSGWVQKIRDKGFIIWVDLRDRYGVTQLVFDAERTPKEIMDQARELGREFVIKVDGEVIERESKNKNIATGDVEVLVKNLTVLNSSETPPFTIEDDTDGGEDLRMKYRYLDIRRKPVQQKLIFRSKVAMAVRNFLSQQDFVEVETPYLIKSTPEGARDFVVPSRMNSGQFYALPQSPQTFKQLLMVGGLDKYFQIVKCFRDEDLRADRQPEFTQIDCEMTFVDQEDILNTFEDLTKHLLKEINGVEVEEFPRMTYDDAMKTYGNDKPDIRFGMKFGELNEVAKHKDFKIFNEAELVVGYHAMHHPFTSPKVGQIPLLATNPGAVKANAYDLVLNGNEIGGGSIRIHDQKTQAMMFDYLGFTEEEAEAQFGFLMNAFKYGAPPHGGIAFGLDRLVAILGGQESIRDFIAFPKNNAGRDVMIDAPAPIDEEQLKELKLQLRS